MFVNMPHQRGRKFQVQVYKLKSDCAEVGERRRRMHCKGSRFGTEKRSSCIAQWMLALLPLRVLTASKTSCAVEPGIGLTPCSWISDDGASHFGRERFVSLLPSELTWKLQWKTSLRMPASLSFEGQSLSQEGNCMGMTR